MISFFKYLILITVLSIGVTSCATTNSNLDVALNKQNVSDGKPSESRSLQKLWGVEIQRVRITAANYMLDFRYKVLDVEKAAPLLDRQVKPYLIVEKNGVHLPVPNTAKMGSLRQHSKTVKANTIYFVFFKNISQIVKRGDKVTIVIGDFKIEHVEVT